MNRKTNLYPLNLMERTVQYKTIVLHCLEDRPNLHEQLRSSRQLLPTLEHMAIELKTSHETWKEQLSQVRPGSDPSQVASEAMEIALKELEERLSAELPPEDNHPISLDAAMACLASFQRFP